MAAPTVYTEAHLKEYVLLVLGRLGEHLDWSAVDMQDVVDEALLVYGTDDIATVTGSANIRKLRALARLQAFKAALVVTAPDYPVTIDQDRYERDKVHQAIDKTLIPMAEQECAALGVGDSAIQIGEMEYGDPSRWQDEATLRRVF